MRSSKFEAAPGLPSTAHLIRGEKLTRWHCLEEHELRARKRERPRSPERGACPARNFGVGTSVREQTRQDTARRSTARPVRRGRGLA